MRLRVTEDEWFAALEAVRNTKIAVKIGKDTLKIRLGDIHGDLAVALLTAAVTDIISCKETHLCGCDWHVEHFVADDGRPDQCLCGEPRSSHVERVFSVCPSHAEYQEGEKPEEIEIDGVEPSK